jgi:hypothetical protein
MPKFEVSSGVPASNVLAKLPYRNRDQWNLKVVSDEKIKYRETEFSWFWFERAVAPTMFSKDRTALHFASNVGERGDDAAFISWETNGYVCELIDSRLLTLLLRKEGLAKSEILEVFKETVNFARYGGGLRIRLTNELTHELSPNKSWGSILVDRDGATDWFNRPIAWYRDGDFVLFVFQKILKPVTSKIGHKPSQVIGGIPNDDARKWLRFEETNRETLAREYYDKRMAQQPRVPFDPKATRSAWPICGSPKPGKVDRAPTLRRRCGAASVVSRSLQMMCLLAHWRAR